MTRVRITLDLPGGFVQHVRGAATGRTKSLCASYTFASRLYSAQGPREVRWRLVEVHIDGEREPRFVCSTRVHELVAVSLPDAQSRDDGGGVPDGGVQQQRGAA